MRSHLSILVGVFILAGCGNGKRTVPSDSQMFAIKSGSCSEKEAGSMEGTCEMLSRVGLGSTKNSKSFDAKFRLQDGGSLTLHAFSSAAKGGVDVTFARQGEALSVTASIAGKTSDYSRKFKEIAASGDLAFQIDIHNGEEPAHMLIWNAVSGPGFTAESVLVNSVPSLNGRTDGNNWETASGSGSELSVSLNKAKLLALNVTGPKFSE